jgi:hypothetical protein
MHGFQAIDVHCKTVRRKMDSGMEEEFLGCRLGISSNLSAFPSIMRMVAYIFLLLKHKISLIS